MKRRVKLTTLFRLLNNKKPYGTLAIVFFVFSLGIGLFMLPFGLVFKSETGGYDFKTIEKYGQQREAKITYIKTVKNLEINGENPVVISYEYDHNGNKVEDKFETLDLKNISGFNIGTTIKILVYNKQSMIKNIKPYSFPGQLFYLIPLPLFIASVVLLLIALFPALGIYNLYKFGVIKDAVIVSVGMDNEMTKVPGFNIKTKIRYFFTDNNQNQVFANEDLKDFLLIGKKEGDSIKIFVSEKGDNKSCVIPILEAVKNNWDLNIV